MEKEEGETSTQHLTQQSLTDVYQSVSTTNEVEDKYARNEVARKAILGPLSVVIKCLGFDSTYSLFKAETRGRVIAWIGTPLLLIGLFVLIGNMMGKMEEVSGFATLSWHWGETFLIFGLAIQSVFSAVFLMRRTGTLFFLEFYEGWSECARLGEKNKEEKEKENGENGDRGDRGDVEIGGSSSSVPRSALNRPIWVILSFFFYTGATVSTSLKYAIYHGNEAMDTNESSTTPLLDKFHSFEPFLSLWGALLSATAISVYGILHGILDDTIDDFNKDLKSASDSKTLSTRLDYFSIRYQALLLFTRNCEKRMGTYATYCAKGVVIANFLAMFLSLSFKGHIGGLGYLCIALWTFIGVGSCVVVFIQPAGVQTKLNKTQEIVIADKEIWSGDSATAEQAQLLLSKRMFTDTTVSLLKCIKLTPWVANGLMMVPPIIGGTFTIFRVFIVNH